MPFQAVLAQVAAQRGVRAAVFCDGDGERVAAAAGDLGSFEVDVLGATFAAIAVQIGEGQALRVRLAESVVWVAPVQLGYYVVVACFPGADHRARLALEGVAAALRAGM
jgi:hypothetical protein